MWFRYPKQKQQQKKKQLNYLKTVVENSRDLDQTSHAVASYLVTTVCQLPFSEAQD